MKVLYGFDPNYSLTIKLLFIDYLANLYEIENQARRVPEIVFPRAEKFKKVIIEFTNSKKLSVCLIGCCYG